MIKQIVHKPVLIALLACNLLLLSHTVKAQLFDGGISYGFSGSSIYGDNHAGLNKLNGNAAMFVETRSETAISYISGLGYTGKGSRFYDKNSRSSYVISLHYVEMPLLGCYRFYHDYFVVGGISPGYLFAGWTSDNGTRTSIFDSDMGSFDLPVSIGLGKNLGKKYKASLRYSYSLFSNSRYYRHWNEEAIFALYYFPLRKKD